MEILFKYMIGFALETSLPLFLYHFRNKCTVTSVTLKLLDERKMTIFPLENRKYINVDLPDTANV